MTSLFGWFFDAYPSGQDMLVWLIDAEGRPHALRDSFTPTFYAEGGRDDLRSLWRHLRSQRAPVDLRLTERIDLFKDEAIEVLGVGVRHASRLDPLFRQTSRAFPDLTYYDADIPMSQRYVIARGVFPLAYCSVEHEDGRIQRIDALDAPWDVEYQLPPLRTMTLRLEGELQNPTRGHRGDLLVSVDGHDYRLPRGRGRRLVLGMQHLLERYDPDVLVSAYGDNFILPRLLELSAHYGIPLPLNRDPEQTVINKRAHSYFSYGRIFFRDQQHTLHGRWHIDRQNAFLSNYYGLDGILEIARVSGLPVQTVARVSTGTGISAMQVSTALRRGVLVPWQKRHPESLKSGLDLFAADKGGLVYTPVAGLYEDVFELDFTAMYPSIMVHFNVSPETVEATCCEGVPVPELGTPICKHRLGLVPETLAPLLDKRNQYKDLIRALPPSDPTRESYERRYSAHKWLLVTCFGYLGYKNARFGRIEAHEAVNAYGREVLLQAKEIVEDAGFNVLHLYVDGLWVQKRGADQAEMDRTIAEIQEQTGLRVGLEGIYRWLAFLPSRTEPRVAVANRYFGAYQDGSLKIRGIEARRHDTPSFIKDTQLELLAILAEAKGVQGYRQTVPLAVAYAREKLRALREGEIPLSQLIMSHRMSRQPEEYRVLTAAARVALQLTEAGIELSPGQMLRFVYVAGPEKVCAWEMVDQRTARIDVSEYTELLLRAVDSVLVPAGVDRQTLETWLLGNAGYWGPPGALPPPGAEIGLPLLSHSAPIPVSPEDLAPTRPERIPLALDYKTSLAEAGRG